MNIRSHPVRLEVLRHFDNPKAHFVVVRSAIQKDSRDVCLHTGYRVMPLILHMPVAAALAAAQALNGLLRLKTNNATEVRCEEEEDTKLLTPYSEASGV